MSLLTVWYTYSDDTALRDTVRPDHRAFLGELAAEGTIVLSGPVSSPEGAPAAALLLVRAESADDALARLANDPFQVNSVVAHMDVREWTPVLGDLFDALA